MRVCDRFCVTDPVVYAALIDDVLEAVTAVVLMANVPLVAPAAIASEAGVVAAAVLELESAIVTPPAGAAAYRFTAPVDVPPP